MQGKKMVNWIMALSRLLLITCMVTPLYPHHSVRCRPLAESSPGTPTDQAVIPRGNQASESDGNQIGSLERGVSMRGRDTGRNGPGSRLFRYIWDPVRCNPFGRAVHGTEQSFSSIKCHRQAEYISVDAHLQAALSVVSDKVRYIDRR
ncbi:hypothetical protein F4780DRAFT_304541 [Xylariomycetidae sp. FL0641]|nr:hypothetical protein F4780DRAFT_304541 [Xylariomycetidae sp. FL0641]